MLARTHHHHRHHGLTGLFVGPREHRRFHQRRVLQQARFHLSRRNFFACAVDHIFDAVHHQQESIGIQVADVAGAEPAIGHGPGGGLGLRPVALHHRDAAQPNFARLTRRQRCAVEVGHAQLDDGREQARGPGPYLKQVTGRGRGHAVGFGQTKAHARHRVATPAQHLVDQPLRQTCTAKAHTA